MLLRTMQSRRPGNPSRDITALVWGEGGAAAIDVADGYPKEVETQDARNFVNIECKRARETRPS